MRIIQNQAKKETVYKDQVKKLTADIHFQTKFQH